MVTRTPESFKRGRAKYRPQSTVLVICEDTKSSKDYLEDAARHFRAYAHFEFLHCGNTDPLGIVKAAVARVKSFDHVYCVIDRDSHAVQNFQQACAEEAKNKDKVTVLTSYPCFEFWLLLHFGYTRSPFMAAGGTSAADKVCQTLKTKNGMAGYAKGSTNGLFKVLLPQLSTARAYAARTVEEGIADNQMNPSTPLHQLIDKLEELGEPIPVASL